MPQSSCTGAAMEHTAQFLPEAFKMGVHVKEIFLVDFER